MSKGCRPCTAHRRPSIAVLRVGRNVDQDIIDSKALAALIGLVNSPGLDAARDLAGPGWTAQSQAAPGGTARGTGRPLWMTSAPSKTVHADSRRALDKDRTPGRPGSSESMSATCRGTRVPGRSSVRGSRDPIATNRAVARVVDQDDATGSGRRTGEPSTVGPRDPSRAPVDRRSCRARTPVNWGRSTPNPGMHRGVSTPEPGCRPVAPRVGSCDL